MIDIPALKAELRAQGQKVTYADLLALSEKNDPYGVFSAGRIEKAEWAAEIWQQMGEPSMFHIRRMHYWLVSSGTKKPDGTIYQNTENDWKWLTDAVKYARYLNLLQADGLTDQRNPAPEICADYTGDYISVGVYDAEYDPDIGMSYHGIFGSVEEYARNRAETAQFNSEIEIDYQRAQPYHIELWAEKSTINDILLPICRRYGANLVTALGQVSLTQCVALVGRAVEANKPVRIFYISDFDPAGLSMPAAAARKIEWCTDQIDVDVDIELVPVALTHEQCIEFQLPRTPIKSSDKSRGKFEERYGEGATELDALEALHPGELSVIMKEAISPFYDADIDDEVQRARNDISNDIAQQIRDGIVEQAPETCDILFKEIHAGVAAMREKVADEIKEIQDKVRELNVLLAELDVDVQSDIDIPRSSMVIETDHWLYDSKRKYMEQMRYYKQIVDGDL